MDQLRPVDLQRQYARWLDEGLAPLTVKHVHTVLCGALRWAVRMELTERNPAEAVKAPRVRRRDVLMLDADQARRLLIAADDEKLGPVIARPPTEVFEFADNPENESLWQRPTKDSEQKSEGHRGAVRRVAERPECLAGSSTQAGK